MAELLLELLSEEIPPSMQESASKRFEKSLREELELQIENSKFLPGISFSTPRRIGIWLEVPHEFPAKIDKKRGPKTTAPKQAINGFRKSLLGSNATITEQDGYYFARIERPAVDTKTLLTYLLPEMLNKFSWPKSMRWPQNPDGGGDFRWVRPLRSVLCILDHETVNFSLGGVQSSNITYGHIFDAPDQIIVSSFADYRQKLSEAHVLIFPKERRKEIQRQMKKNADMMSPLENDFINQAIRLSEYPILQEFQGNFDSENRESYSLPGKIKSSILMKENCLPLYPGALPPDFIICIDGNKKNNELIAKGFSVVLQARMKDAAFYINKDYETGLKRLREKLKDISFHPKLGNFFEKVERFEKLSLGQTLQNLFPDELWDDVIQLAAHYAKADIASQSGREFPEALGEIASQLFWHATVPPAPQLPDPPGPPDSDLSLSEPSSDISDEDSDTPNTYIKIPYNVGEEIGKIIASHYDPVPPTNAGRILALADRADTLAGFFSIGEMPTGSKDPFALRRAALSIIRIILENETDFQKLDLNDLFAEALDLYSIQDKKPILEKLRAFITERLKFYLRAQDQSADFVAAAMRAESGLNLVRIQARLRALAQFLNTKDGDHLMTAWRRLSGILKETASASASGSASDCANPPAIERFTEPAEKKLAQALRMEDYKQALADHDFPRAFALLAQLRAPVDDFFDNVRVNVDDPELRQNRLALCAALHSIMRQAADFSSIAGKS